jgi:hypothetical protein
MIVAVHVSDALLRARFEEVIECRGVRGQRFWFLRELGLGEVSGDGFRHRNLIAVFGELETRLESRDFRGQRLLLLMALRLSPRAFLPTERRSRLSPSHHSM